MTPNQLPGTFEKAPTPVEAISPWTIETMEKPIRDWYLVGFVFIMCLAAILALFKFHELQAPWRQVVFSSFFLNPSILLYGVWKGLKDRFNIPRVLLALIGAIGTSIWVAAILAGLTRVAT